MEPEEHTVMMSSATYTPNFGKISSTPHIPGYFQIPLETSEPITSFGSDVTVEILVNGVVIHQVDIDEILNDIMIDDQPAIININPDPSNPCMLGYMFIQNSNIDMDAIHDAVKIVVRL